MISARLFHLSSILLAVAVLGCSSATGTVEGTITVDGEPVQGVEVIYQCPSFSAEGSGITNSEGHYRVFYGRGNRDLPIGEYQLSLGIMLPEDSSGASGKLHKKVKFFNDNSRSEQVKSGNNVIDIEVSKGSA